MNNRQKAGIKMWEKYYEEYPQPPEGKKRCSKCGEKKYFNIEQKDISEFHIRQNQAYRMMEAGAKNAVQYRPDSWCKVCKNADSTARRKRRMAEDPERERELRKKKDKEYRERIGEERWLMLKRQRSRAYRRRRGIGLDRDVDERPKDKSGMTVPAEPFAQWVSDTWPEGGYYTAIVGTLPNADKVAKIMNGKQQSVDPEWVDMVLTHFNGPHLSQLYPELYVN